MPTTVPKAPHDAPGRQGKRGILLHVDSEFVKRLRQIALDEDTTPQVLGVEAVERIVETRPERDR